MITLAVCVHLIIYFTTSSMSKIKVIVDILIKVMVNSIILEPPSFLVKGNLICSCGFLFSIVPDAGQQAEKMN